METGRGKKGKKAGWHLNLGVRDAIFAGIGLVGMLMMSFALGVLAGRGDIYRAAYSWGLLNRDGAKVAQWMPVPGAPGAAPGPTPGTATSATVASVAAPAPAPAPVAAKPARPAPVTGSVAPLPPPAAAKKKGKTVTTHHDLKAREEEMRRERQAVVPKLKFQNSFDTGPKPRLPKAKDHDKSQPTQVRVAEYRTSKEAQAKIAELHKKGIKTALKKATDSKGTVYTVYKLTSPPPPVAEKLVKKPEKTSGAAHKPKVD